MARKQRVQARDEAAAETSGQRELTQGGHYMVSSGLT
jgi:hypothetical protein